MCVCMYVCIQSVNTSHAWNLHENITLGNIARQMRTCTRANYRHCWLASALRKNAPSFCNRFCSPLFWLQRTCASFSRQIYDCAVACLVKLLFLSCRFLGSCTLHQHGQKHRDQWMGINRFMEKREHMHDVPLSWMRPVLPWWARCTRRIQPPWSILKCHRDVAARQHGMASVR